MVQDDLKWDAQIKLMVRKASAKIWLLRRMKQIGVDELTIVSYWKSEGLVHQSGQEGSILGKLMTFKGPR